MRNLDFSFIYESSERRELVLYWFMIFCEVIVDTRFRPGKFSFASVYVSISEK